MPHLRPADGSARIRRIQLSVTMVRARIALAVCTALLSGFALGACGSSSVSDAVPKSTPDIVPPNDTSAEKAAIQTTSTSTTKTKTSTSESSETESPEGETSSETGGSASEETASGGTESEEKTPEKSSKTEEPESSSPTGGASAP